MNIRSDNDFIRYFTTLDKYFEKYDESDFSECTLSLIKQMLIYCSYQPKGQSGSSPHNKLVRSVVEYVSENLTEPLNAEIISKHFFISPSYLQNTFSSVMHIGLKQYILQKKIYAARADMEKGISPGEVCKKYQFNDYTGFYRLYKKYFGSSPKDIFADTEN
jgi:YesN/AraC family two-component response regulator